MAKFIKYLAKTTKSLNGQLVLVRNSGNYEELADNAYLHLEPWFIMYNSKPKAEIAEKLLKRELNTDQINLVLAKEQRIGAMQALVSCNFLNEEQGRLLISKKKLYPSIAHAWYKSGKVPNPLKEQVALQTGSMIEYALENDSLSDDAVFKIINEHGYSICNALDALIEKRKNLVNKLASNEKYVIRLTAVSSRHIFDQELMLNALKLCKKFETHKQYAIASALLENPNSSVDTLKLVLAYLTEGPSRSNCAFFAKSLKYRLLFTSGLSVEKPWEEETDPAKVKLITSYARYNKVRNKTVSSLTNLTASTHSTVEESENKNMTTGLQNNYSQVDLQNYRVPIEGVSGTINWLSDELDTYGTNAWEAANMLLQTGYQGTLGDLVETAKNI